MLANTQIMRNAHKLYWIVLGLLNFLFSTLKGGELGYLSYLEFDGQITITDCREEAENITIPEKIDGFPVTAIGSSAFYAVNNLISVSMPESITRIGNSAFEKSQRLTSVGISNSVEFIGNNAFADCIRLDPFELPERVTRIGDGAFFNCYRFSSVEIPDSVISIGDKCFMGISGMTSAVVGKSVVYIGEQAFRDCSSLKNINLPNSVIILGDHAFIGCSALKSIGIPQVFRDHFEADRIGLINIWPGGFYENTRLGQARAYAKIVNGFVVEVILSHGGSNYDETPTIRFSGGGGSGANAVATVVAGEIASIEIMNPGRGYSSPPNILIDPPSGGLPSHLSLRMVPAVTVTGGTMQSATLEVSDTPDGPWTEWRTVVVGEEGTTEFDLDEGAEKRFYRVRD